jgi:hypothetical protein
MKLVVMWNAAYTLPSPHASIALLEEVQQHFSY